MKLVRAASFGLLLAVTSIGCEKVDLLAPTQSTIQVNASSRILPTGGSTEITATVVEQAGTPVHNGTTVTFTTSLGRVEPARAQTQNGIARTMFFAGDTSGVAEVRATSGGATGGEGETASNVVEITIGAAAIDAVTLSASQGFVPASGGTVTLTASVFAENNRALSGVPVTFSTTEGTLSATRVVTDSNGDAQTTLTTNRTAIVTARAGAEESNEVEIARRDPTPRPSVTLDAAAEEATPRGQRFTFTANVTGVDDTGDVQVVEYKWNFGDGSSTTTNGNIVAHVYDEEERTRTVTVEVKLSDGSEITASTQIQVVDFPNS